MKTLGHVLSAATLAVLVVLSAHAQQAPQRAAANHFELNRSSGSGASPAASGQSFTYLAGGKAAAAIQDSRKSAPDITGVDIAHAPRPITASKDPDLERKWRENAQQFQVAPVK